MTKIVGMTVQVHQVTIEAHRRYQELMAESHRAFLNMASTALSQITGASVAPGVHAAAPVPLPAPAVIPVADS